MTGSSADFGDLPIGMAVGVAQRLHAAEGLGFYVRHKGDPDRGLVSLYFEDENLLLIQERDFASNRLIWRKKSLPKEASHETLSRMEDRDPDSWIIELDGRLEKNPFARLG